MLRGAMKEFRTTPDYGFADFCNPELPFVQPISRNHEALLEKKGHQGVCVANRFLDR